MKGPKTENQITTYKERSLHASLKRHFCPDERFHELKIGRCVADACYGGVIYEIQTGSFSPLAKKIKYYLENTDYKIVVVRPLAQNRHLLWLDAESGEVVNKPKLSPKHEDMRCALPELLYVRELLGNDRLSFCFVLMEIDEIKLLDGYGKDRKFRAHSLDKVAGEIYSQSYINTIDDVRTLTHNYLPDGEFSRDELSKSLKLSGRKLWSAQKLLTQENIITERREGKRLIFEKS